MDESFRFSIILKLTPFRRKDGDVAHLWQTRRALGSLVNRKRKEGNKMKSGFPRQDSKDVQVVIQIPTFAP